MADGGFFGLGFALVLSTAVLVIVIDLPRRPLGGGDTRNKDDCRIDRVNTNLLTGGADVRPKQSWPDDGPRWARVARVGNEIDSYRRQHPMVSDHARAGKTTIYLDMP